MGGNGWQHILSSNHIASSTASRILFGTTQRALTNTWSSSPLNTFKTGSWKRWLILWLGVAHQARYKERDGFQEERTGGETFHQHFKCASWAYNNSVDVDATCCGQMRKVMNIVCVPTRLHSTKQTCQDCPTKIMISSLGGLTPPANPLLSLGASPPRLPPSFALNMSTIWHDTCTWSL